MTSDGALVAALVYGLPMALVLAAYAARRTRRQARAAAALAASHAAGLTEPPSLHPAVNPNRCLGCGSCIPACPEGDVLGLVAGKAVLVNPTHCIGHGACREACPCDAITLVLGSESRPIEIPRHDASFATNVPGIYVAGEVGGMGLVRNAITQGVEALEAIAARRGGAGGDALDVVIVGAGPAGIAASLAAKQRGLRFVTLEQESLGGTVAHYPRGKIVMTAPCDLPLYGRVHLRETTKEALLALWTEVVRKTGLTIRHRERVEAIARTPAGFEVTTTRAAYRARAVLLAIGRRGTPARLGVPGEEQPKVVYRLLEPEQYRGRRVLVVGGGDSALEAAASVADEPGTDVAIAYRGAAFSRAKVANRERVAQAERSGRLHVFLESTVAAIGRDTVRLRTPGGEKELANDAVIVCAGGVLPSAFLRACGVEIEKKHGTPLF
ncbi:MAG: 4Fe-4S ferredoxin [Proteobacteria bacterium]|nr:MAG: 4Fe-4S ferredoxin [Pseudomonadota bacterium]